MIRTTRLTAMWKTVPRSPAAVTQPIVKKSLNLPDTFSAILNVAGWGLFGVTYAIISNWIYEGYVDLWHGTYGLDDDDDD